MLLLLLLIFAKMKKFLVLVLKRHDSQATFGSRCFNKYVIFKFPTSRAFSYSPMPEVLSAVTGESIAVFEKTDFADVKALNRRFFFAEECGVLTLPNYGVPSPTTANWMMIKPSTEDETLSFSSCTARDPGISSA